MKVRNLFVALALTASAFSIGATGAFADTAAPVNNGGDASAPPGCPMGTVRDASGTVCTASPTSSTTTTSSTAPTATAPTASAPTAAPRSSGVVAGTTSGTSGSAAGSGAALANTGTPVTPLLLGLIMLALGGLVVLRTRTTA